MNEEEYFVKMLEDIADQANYAQSHKGKRGCDQFTVQVVENGYVLTMNGDQYVYSTIDEIVDKFMKDFPNKPQERFE